MRKALLLLLWFVGTAQARGGMPTPSTERGRIVEDIYFQIFVAGVLVFLLVFGLLVFVLWRYRENSGHGRATHEHERENLKAELTWTIIPLIIVLWVGVISYGGLVELDEEALDRDFASYAALRTEGGALAEGKGMLVDITASQYNWQASYGQGVNVFSSPDSQGAVSDANVFHVPAGVPIRFDVTSLDVIHAFYIQDAGLGPVGMVDANPNGPHKVNSLVVTFTPGEYKVQCKEMCLNPGHAYMRARILAEPQADFDAWYEEKVLETRCGDAVIMKAAFAIAGSGITSADAENGTITAVAGTCLIATFENQRGQDAEVTIAGASLTVPAGGTVRDLLNFTDAGGYTLAAGPGDVVEFDVIQAEVVEVTLYEYAIVPQRIELVAGETYLFQVRNTGGAPHNIKIGMTNGQDEVTWGSATIDGGASTSFLVQPKETVSLDTWCDIPGHKGLGMRGTLVVN